jgi:vacuolar-type H+-ATPase subunit I/STV1
VKLNAFAAGVGLLSLLAAGPSAAQAPDAGAAAAAKPTAAVQDSSNTSTGEKKKPKKVWTNDEMSSVHGTVSVVGDTRSSPVGQEKKAQQERAGNANDDTRSKEIENCRSQIHELRSQIDAIDQRAAQLKSFRAENTSPSGGINLNHGYNMAPIEEQLKQLEARKKQLESKIADIEIAAEKKGIEPGDLR